MGVKLSCFGSDSYLESFVVGMVLDGLCLYSC